MMLVAAVVATALAGGLVALLVGLAYPHEIGAFQFVFRGVCAFGFALTAVGLWSRRAQRS